MDSRVRGNDILGITRVFSLVSDVTPSRKDAKNNVYFLCVLYVFARDIFSEVYYFVGAKHPQNEPHRSTVSSSGCFALTLVCAGKPAL
jgi:hypothetical protein